MLEPLPVRYLTEILTQFAEEKFVLLSGPRQVGKTTLAKQWLSSFEHGKYLNWDIAEDREQILTRSFLASLDFDSLVLDELHKHQRWKNWLKGLYDRNADGLRVLVTGSARLETFHKSGDSLLGRYELLRLHPFSIGELTHGQLCAPPDNWIDLNPPQIVDQAIWDQLLRRSGFPEPFTRDNTLQHNRWRRQRRSLLVRQDLRDLSEVKLLALVEELVMMLPSRVGSPLSINALREDLGVAHDTVSSWLESLERIYLCYRLRPFQKRLNRSLTKERKLYLWDWSEVQEPGARFENMVASHLLKAVHAWTDVGYGEYELMYWRDRQGREIDFVIIENDQPVVFIEAKLSDQTLASSLDYISNYFPSIPRIQLVNRPGVDCKRGSSRIVSASTLLAALP